MISNSILIPYPYLSNTQKTQQSSCCHHVLNNQASKIGLGTASFCLDDTISSVDLQKARERIRKEREDDKSLSQKLRVSKK